MSLFHSNDTCKNVRWRRKIVELSAALVGVGEMRDDGKAKKVFFLLFFAYFTAFQCISNLFKGKEGEEYEGITCTIQA